jgi:transposase-like protein
MPLTEESFLPDAADCAETWRALRWPDGPECVECGSSDVAVQARSYRGHLRRYECRQCGRWFSDRTGTFLEHSKVDLKVWVYVLREMQKGRAPTAFAEEVPCSPRTARRMAEVLREAIREEREGWIGSLTGMKEAGAGGGPPPRKERPRQAGPGKHPCRDTCKVRQGAR